MSKQEKVRSDSTEFTAVFDQVERAVYDVGYGSVKLIMQDGKIIQIEKLDKIRVGYSLSAPTCFKSNAILRAKIAEAMEGMSFGQVMIIIKNNRAVQIERTEKQRVNSLQGLYGDGI